MAEGSVGLSTATPSGANPFMKVFVAPPDGATRISAPDWAPGATGRDEGIRDDDVPVGLDGDTMRQPKGAQPEATVVGVLRARHQVEAQTPGSRVLQSAIRRCRSAHGGAPGRRGGPGT